MKLMTQALRDTIPPLYANEGVADPLVQVKFFTPDAACTWLILEFDGEDTLYGWCDLGMPDCAELGYVLLSELLSLRGRLGLPVERDLYWTPKPLSQAKKEMYG